MHGLFHSGYKSSFIYWWALILLHILTVASKVSVNIGVCLSFWTSHFAVLRGISRGGIVGSHSISCVFSEDFSRMFYFFFTWLHQFRFLPVPCRLPFLYLLSNTSCPFDKLFAPFPTTRGNYSDIYHHKLNYFLIFNPFFFLRHYFWGDTHLLIFMIFYPWVGAQG